MFQCWHFKSTTFPTLSSEFIAIQKHSAASDTGWQNYEHTKWIVKTKQKYQTLWCSAIFLSRALYNYYEPTICVISNTHTLETFRPRQNDRHFAESIPKCILQNGNHYDWNMWSGSHEMFSSDDQIILTCWQVPRQQKSQDTCQI